MTVLKIVLPLIYVLNLSIVLGIFGIGLDLTTLSFIVLLKSVMEFSLLFVFSSKVDSKAILKYFPLAIFLHPFYVVVYGAWGILGKFTWKGQTDLH